MKNTLLIISGVGVVGLIGVSVVIGNRNRKRERLTSKLLIKLNARIEPVRNGIGSQNAFDIDYLEKVIERVNGQVLALKESTAEYYAKQIKSGFIPWYRGGDDEDKIYGVFRKLKDKVQVSQVAKAYQENESKNLIDVLKERFGKDEIKIVLDIVNSKPNYRTT